MTPRNGGRLTAHPGAAHVAVDAPPHDPAKRWQALGVRRADLRLVTGATSRTKIVEIDADVSDRLHALLEA